MSVSGMLNSEVFTEKQNKTDLFQERRLHSEIFRYYIQAKEVPVKTRSSASHATETLVLFGRHAE